MSHDNEQGKGARDMIFWLKIIPVVGWLFIVAGMITPFEHYLFRLAWWIDISLCVGLHFLQLAVAIPIGRKAGMTDVKIIINTMVFGALWWKPLKKQF